MRVVIPDDYQDAIRHLDCFQKLADHHVTIYTAFDQVLAFANGDSIDVVNP